MGYAKDWSKVKAPTLEDRVLPTDIWEVYRIPRKLRPVRFIGPVVVYAEHWVAIKTKEGKRVVVGAICPDFDPVTESSSRRYGCPACQVGIPLRLRYATNIIVRDEQEALKINKKILKTKKDDYLTKDLASLTPVKVIILPVTVVRTIRELEQEVNIYKGKSYPVAHPKFGRDVLIRFDDTKSAPEMYRVILGDKRTPLTKIEKRYKLWNLEDVEKIIGDPQANLERLTSLVKKADIPDKPKELEEDTEPSIESEEPDIDLSKKDYSEQPKGSLVDRIYLMSRQELKKFIKKKKLPIKVKKSMTDDDIRDAILEELNLV